MKFVAFLLTLLTVPVAIAGEHSSSGNVSRIGQIERFYSEYQRRFKDVPSVSAAELTSLQKDATVLTLDVRTAKERRVSMIPHAISQDEFERDENRYKGRKLVVYCTIGYRSGLYAEKLRKKGWNAFNLKGGVLAWADAHQLFVDPTGKQTKAVHTYGQKWNLLPEEYEGVW